MPRTIAPFFFAILVASRVSAVSPDWDITKTTSPLLIIGNLYLNSDAYSTSTGTLRYFSKKYSATRPACHEVPHPIIIILFVFKRGLVYD